MQVQFDISPKDLAAFAKGEKVRLGSRGSSLIVTAAVDEVLVSEEKAENGMGMALYITKK